MFSSGLWASCGKGTNVVIQEWSFAFFFTKSLGRILVSMLRSPPLVPPRFMFLIWQERGGKFLTGPLSSPSSPASEPTGNPKRGSQSQVWGTRMVWRPGARAWARGVDPRPLTRTLSLASLKQPQEQGGDPAPHPRIRSECSICSEKCSHDFHMSCVTGI